jgi:hypothetical protein
MSRRRQEGDQAPVDLSPGPPMKVPSSNFGRSSTTTSSVAGYQCAVGRRRGWSPRGHRRRVGSPLIAPGGLLRPLERIADRDVEELAAFIVTISESLEAARTLRAK